MGGSGGSGQVGYADYIEHSHELLITGELGAATFTNNLEAVLATVTAGNPYASHTAYSPDTALGVMTDAVANFEEETLTLIDDDVIDDAVDTFDTEATVQLNNVTIPKYNTLMRDICAVQSSTFVIGRASLLASKDRDVSKYRSELQLTWKKLYIQSRSDVMTTTIEVERFRIASKHDEEQRDAEVDKLNANWKLDTLIKGGQFLGILGGGTMVPEGANKTQSAIAGGLAGAAAGAYAGAQIGTIGGLPGAAVGAVAGGLLGAGSAFL